MATTIISFWQLTQFGTSFSFLDHDSSVLDGWIGLPGWFPCSRAGILHGCSWLHLCSCFSNCVGGNQKNDFGKKMFNFFMGFTCSTIAVACLVNSSPKSIGAAELKLLATSAINFTEGFNFSISFFHLSWAVYWYTFPIKYKTVLVAEPAFTGVKSLSSALFNTATWGATVSNQNC